MSHNFLSSTPEDMAHALADQNRLFREREAQQKAALFHLPYVNLFTFPIDLNVMSLFSEAEATAAETLPFFKEGHDLRLATINPQNQLLQEKLREMIGKFKVSLYFVSTPGFSSTLKFYKKIVHPVAHSSNIVRIDSKTDTVAELKKLADSEFQQAASATDLLATVLGAAFTIGASDIHLEPEEHILKIRFRVDGVLQDMLHLSSAQQQSLVTRLKMVAKLKLNVTTVPQDGRLTFYEGDKAIDVRVSILPSAYGEAVVMRLLGVGATTLKLDQLGLRGRAYEIIEHELNKPNGMIITTGPTGSGKTTTLYAFLNELNEPGVKIITLEDPVEYKLEGIQQTPIDYHHDFNFAKGLRSILRQDPDIVMVGEIRDGETADTALQAALTGHIVLSTLHTNDASGAVPRLLVMGVKPFVIAPAMNAIIAQRLVRKLCLACRIPVTDLKPELAQSVEQILKSIPENAGVQVPAKMQFYHSPGCTTCHNLGYQGRIGIYEVMQVNDNIKDLILKSAGAQDLKRQAFSDGMITMLQDGVLKALEGITDIEEVFRVAGDS